jgi:peptidoglycan/xylan/chitin deacetylase (PgdA/CDA1 family)
MTWEEVGELVEAGWLIGAHTVSHPDLSALSVKDPSGQLVRDELEQCDETLEKRLGVRPRDLAYTGTTWSSAAEREVMKRYRFGRLWIVGTEYQADGGPIRFAELAGIPGPDEDDGGPPYAARYITEETHAYRLPSMELTALIHEPEAFRRYLEGAVPPVPGRAPVGPLP